MGWGKNKHVLVGIFSKINKHGGALFDALDYRSKEILNTKLYLDPTHQIAFLHLLRKSILGSIMGSLNGGPRGSILGFRIRGSTLYLYHFSDYVLHLTSQSGQKLQNLSLCIVNTSGRSIENISIYGVQPLDVMIWFSLVFLTRSRAAT